MYYQKQLFGPSRVTNFRRAHGISLDCRSELRFAISVLAEEELQSATIAPNLVCHEVPFMNKPAGPAESLNIEQLLHLHTLTKEVSKLCQKQLRAYLDTMALLLRPRRMLGDFIEGAERETAGGSERTIAELKDLYRKVALRPFDLRPEL